MNILVIGMADSVHLSRWLAQFRDGGYKFTLISSSPHRRVHPQLEELISRKLCHIPFISRYFSLPFWLLDKFLGNTIRALLVAWVTKKYKPDLVHVLEFQNAGYVYLRGLRLSQNLSRIPLLLTPYGSDIYWFKQFPRHLRKIRALLARADVLSSECQRDEMLALANGFKGKFGPRIPAFGGLQFSHQKEDRSSRNAIAVKGYQNRWGRALNALRAIENLGGSFSDMEVVLFSCNQSTVRAAKKFAKATGRNVTAFRKGKLRNDEVIAIFRRSAVYIGLSRSDGISASMIEAMANGAVPIQSDTSCCDEWLEHGVGGFLVDYDDVDGVSRALARILSDPSFQSNAAARNLETLGEKLRPSSVAKAAIETYEMVTTTN